MSDSYIPATVKLSQTASLSWWFSLAITNLCKRKLAMSYFSVLAMYVRYGTDLTLDDVKKLLSEYKTVKKDFLKYEKRPKIHIISFLMCTDIKKMRDFYQKLFSGKTNL
jgi:hypothetical protein